MKKYLFFPSFFTSLPRVHIQIISINWTFSDYTSCLWNFDQCVMINYSLLSISIFCSNLPFTDTMVLRNKFMDRPMLNSSSFCNKNMYISVIFRDFLVWLDLFQSMFYPFYSLNDLQFAKEVQVKWKWDLSISQAQLNDRGMRKTDFPLQLNLSLYSIMSV